MYSLNKKTMKSLKTLQLLFTCFILLSPMLLLAQPSFDDNVDDVPIDGGLSLLVAAGIGFAAKKIKRKNNNIITEKVVE